MIYQRGHLARPLDAILGHASRLAALRALNAAPEGLSGREVARRAGINHQAAALALKALEKAGVARSLRRVRSIQWVLDVRQEIVAKGIRPLLAQEARNPGDLVGAVRLRLKRHADAVIIVGKAAQGRLEVGEPLELAVACEPGRRRGLHEALRELTAELDARFATTLKATVVRKNEAKVRLDILDGWQIHPGEGRPSPFTDWNC